MKAIEYTTYGSPEGLELNEVEKPVPQDGEVLIRVRAASVNPGDVYKVKGMPYFVRTQTGWLRPRVTRLGVDLAGQVEAVGRKVTRFKPGDEVFGARTGAFAEYVCKLETPLVLKPAHLTFEQAAAVPVAAITALQGLRDHGRIQPGQDVLVNGAAGGVGTFAVQIAKAFGARVTGVCSPRNVDLVRSLGADAVIDYTQTDFTQTGQRYDLVFDNVGNHPLSVRGRFLSPTGILVVVGAPPRGRWLGPAARLFQALVLSRLGRQNVTAFIASITQADLVVLKEMLEARKLMPVIDRCYPLNEVPAALRYLAGGHARGKVIITLDAPNKLERARSRR